MAGRIRSLKPDATRSELDRYYRTTTLPVGPVVYLVQAGDGGPIKIGYAHNLRHRLAVLQTGNHVELRVIGWIENGSRSVERAVHVELAADRLRGDWFNPTRSVMAFAAKHERQR